MNKNRFDINEEELTLLKELVSIKGKKFEGFDDLGFLKDLPITAYKLPERMLKFLNEFNMILRKRVIVLCQQGWSMPNHSVQLPLIGI